MDDTISRQAAINAVSEACFELRGIFKECEDRLLALPSTQPQCKSAYLIDPNPYGKCSICGQLIDIRDEYNYCPNCGSRMEGESDE